MALNRVGIPVAQVNNHFTVFVCGSLSMILPAPDFDNHEKYETLRVNRRTRGGDLKLFRADYWPRTKVLSWQWSSLDASLRAHILFFLRATLGKGVRVYAYDNEVYNGVIRTPEGEFTENQNGLHVVKLDFETE